MHLNFHFLLQINNADFSCPSWFPMGAKSLINRILDPNPETVRIENILGCKLLACESSITCYVAANPYFWFLYLLHCN